MTTTPPQRPPTIEVAPVERSHERAREAYNRMARWYDLMAAPFEGPHTRRMVEMLDVQPSEVALDVGFGTGDVVRELAERVGDDGRVAGVDISTKMKQVATEKLRRRELIDRTDLRVADACSLPFSDASFDVVCMSFTLELFSVDEMQQVLGECRRVLRPAGRLGITSMSSHQRTTMSRLYEALRQYFPAQLDCRPIPVDTVLEARHFDVRQMEWSTMAMIPVAIAVATPR